MEINHKVTVNGMLNINSQEVAKAVKDSVSGYIVQEVARQLGTPNSFQANGTDSRYRK